MAGIFGGVIMQLLTLDIRRPATKVVVGDIMSSAFSGWAVYVFSGSQFLSDRVLGIAREKEGEIIEFRLVLIVCVVFGTFGSAGLRAIISRIKPHWMDKKNERSK